MIMIGHIGNEENAVVTVAGAGKSKKPHGLEDGDYVKFEEVEGLDGINYVKNDNNVYKVKTITAFTFSVSFNAKDRPIYGGEGRIT